MLRAWCGFTLVTYRRRLATAVSGVAIRARATLRPRAVVDVVPAAGSFVVLTRASRLADDQWTAATSAGGAWGTAHLAVPDEYGTVLTVERTKEAPVMEEEDAHGCIAKAVIGSERQTVQIRTVLRLATDLGTGDALEVAGVTWYAVSVQTVWSMGEWAELVIVARRWPDLTRVGTFGPQALED